MGDGSGWGLEEEVTSDPDEVDDSDEPALAESADTTDDSQDAAVDAAAEAETEAVEEEPDNETLEDRLRHALEQGDVTEVTTSDVMNDYKEVEDPDLLKQALREDDRKSALKLYRRQLRNLDYEVKDEVGAPDSAVTVEEGVRKTEQAGLEEASNGKAAPTTSAEQEADSATDANGESEDSVEQTSDTAEQQEETSDAEPDTDGSEVQTEEVEADDSGSDVEEVETTPEMEATAEVASEKGASGQGPPSQDEIQSAADDIADNDGVTPIDASSVAPGSMTVAEAAQKEKRHKIMAFGPPGTFKTHFGYTMPEPICIIDCEGKAHDIAHKFSDKAIHIFQPSNYLEAAGGTDRRGVYQEGALEKALNLLDQYREQQGVTGTLVVDSMSKMWEWSQLHYISKWHPDDDRPLDEVREDFKSGLESDGPGSWGRIKRYHNAQFRQPMVDSPYHLYWTAKQKEDYSVVFEDDAGGDEIPLIPDGEKDNIHEVDTIIHAHLEDGDKVGDLKKSGFTNHGYHGMGYPTFPKHKRVIEKISEWEAEDDVPNQVDMDGDTIQIVRGVNVLE